MEPRILIFGCQAIAIDIIQMVRGFESVGFWNDGYVFPKLVGVVTHDEERDKIFQHESVSEYCFVNSIPSIRMEKVSSEVIAALDPDIIFSVYYRKIIPKSVLKIPRLGCINIHPGMLPKYRGPNPTYWSVRNGDLVAGTTIHYMDEGMDTGDIIAQKGVAIRNMTGYELNNQMMKVGADLFRDNFVDIMCERNNRIPQKNSLAMCVIPFKNNFRYIDWNQSQKIIHLLFSNN